MTAQILHGDCREVIKTIADCSIDSVVTDPPYALVSIVKRFGKTAHADDTKTSDRTRRGADGYARLAKGFMGQEWDNGSTAFDPAFWAEILRTLKPGAHLVAFSGTRTYHRMTCAIEDAGFEVRDQIGWLFGSGFPKSHNAGNGWGTALKPAWEPICLARKPLIGTVAANMAEHGTGAINVDGCRINTEESLNGGGYAPRKEGNAWEETGGMNKAGASAKGPFIQPIGRWPANIVHDGSEEVLAGFPDSAGQQGDVSGSEPSNPLGENTYGVMTGRVPSAKRGDLGSAARFFYTAKADAEDRFGSKHPTVKPVDLMQWLVRLVTPKGGTVLDPFAGTGTTGEAAIREGMNCILIERETEYLKDIHVRMEHAKAGPIAREHARMKNSGKTEGMETTPLFGGAT